MVKAIAFLFVLLVAPAVYAQTTHTVGGTSGWDSGVNYANWAKGVSFASGDSIVFNYDFSHAVDEVSEDDYNSCSSANSISSDSNSPTTIALSGTSTRYFICPRSNHCSQGMKLAVTVGSSAPSPPSGGTTPSPPSGGETPSPPSGDDTPSPPATTTPASPPPPAGSAAPAVGGGKSLMAGLLVVLGAVAMG